MSYHQFINNALQSISTNSDWQVTGPVIKSRECDIYRAFSSSAGLTIAIKRYVSDVRPAASRQQYNALQQYQSSMTAEGAQFRVPKVYLYDTEHRLLFMEWVAGKSFHHCFWLPLIYRKTSRTCLQRTGQWLRHFHDSATIEMRDVDFSDYLKGIENQLKENQETHPLQGTRQYFFHNAYAFLQQTISVQPKTEGPCAIQHGDFTPFNLLLNDDKTCGLDIWATQRKSVDVDLARMVTYLTVAYPLLTRGSVYSEEGQLQELLDPLFHGYGLDRVNPTSTQFKISLLAEYLRRWWVISCRPHTIKGAVTDRYLLRQIEKQVRIMLAVLRSG